jgi:hypothetical protein
MVAILVLAVATVPLAGGRLQELAGVRLRLPWTLPVALAIQLVITTVVPNGPRTLYAGAHLVSYGFGATFLAANRRIPGIWLLALGASLNLVVIVANGGVMPADPDALRLAGWPVTSSDFENSTALADPRLAFLGDVFAIPEAVPLANVFSIGDVLIVIGGIWALHRICGSRLVPSGRRRSAGHLGQPDRTEGGAPSRRTARSGRGVR